MKYKTSNRSLIFNFVYYRVQLILHALLVKDEKERERERGKGLLKKADTFIHTLQTGTLFSWWVKCCGVFKC